MPEQSLVVSPAIVGVLVQVDDLLFITAAKRFARQGGSGDRGSGGS